MRRFPSSLLAFEDYLMEGKVYYFEARDKTLYALKYEENKYRLYKRLEQNETNSYEGIANAVARVFELIGELI